MKPFRPFLAAALALAATVVAPAKVWTVEEAVATADERLALVQLRRALGLPFAPQP
jgi:hypothetical protein